MTSSFSQYASKFLNTRLVPGASVASSQPLFYSFQESSDGEGSMGRPRPFVQSQDDLELGDNGEPRLREEDLDDPYLRLDDDDGDGTLRESTRLLASEVPSTQGGWLAHQTSPLPSRSPTPTPPSSEDTPSPNIVDPQLSTRTTLTESLLPRDGVSRSVFFLPDPGRTARHRYNDANWTVIWCTNILISFLASILSLFMTQSPSFPTPFSTLTRTIPLLTILTVLCTCLSYSHTLLLRYFTRPMLFVTTVFIPISLIFSALSAFSGSFIYNGPLPNTWGATIGLRLFSLLPLVFAVLASRSLLSCISQVNRTARTVHLTTSLLLSNPPLLAVSPALLFVALLSSLPFLSLIFRLLLVGYGDEKWHVRPHAIWMAVFASLLWIWSWCVIRGVLRVTAAGVVGAWFFQRRDAAADPIPGQLQTTHAALSRAWGPCFGTICLSALIQACVGSILFLLHGLRQVTSPTILPAFLHPLSIPIVLLSNTLTPYSFSGYTLPYAGLTGDAFFPSSRRAREITSVKRPSVTPPTYTLLSTLLTMSSLSLSSFLAICSYLFTTHVLSRPEDAPLGALLTGALAFLVVWFCGGIVEDTADALYVCHCLDREAGAHSRQEVTDAFEGPRPTNVV